MNQLHRLIDCLRDADIDFVIVGGFAGMLHGSTLVTRDLDICAVLTQETVAKLREALADLNPTHRLTPQRLSFLDNRRLTSRFATCISRRRSGPSTFSAPSRALAITHACAKGRSRSSCLDAPAGLSPWKI